MSETEQTVGVCLYQLNAKDQAVLQRVLSFSGAQGRHFKAAELDQAQIVVLADQTDVALEQLAKEDCFIIRIMDAGNSLPCDVELHRPLLVTRVMRTLDEARRLWLAGEIPDNVTLEPVARPAMTTLSHLEPTPTAPEPVPNSIETTAIPTMSPAVRIPERETESVIPQVLAAGSAVEVPFVSLDASQETVTYHHYALVVDDSAAIRKQLEIELAQAGIGADFAEDGEQALAKVAERRYDLIFLDIIMPGIDGFETCRQMRLRKEMKKTPIIMLSAKTSPLDEVQGVIAGASTYLTKPVKTEHLQKTLKRVSTWLDNYQVSR